MNYSNIDYTRRETKEDEDYRIASAIFHALFRKGVRTEKTSGWTIQDMNYSALSDNNEIKQTGKVEIKSRNQDMDRYDDLPIKMKKYSNMIEQCQGDTRCIYMVLLNECEYYIFDLKKIDINACDCRLWTINDTEYMVDSSKGDKKIFPAIFIPVEYAIKHGRYYYDKKRKQTEVLQ